jgi:hypothetical protein
MKGDTIPDNNHIARLCFPKHVDNEQIQATAFQLRPSNDDFLSVNWLEFLNCQSRESEIEEIQKVYCAKLDVRPRAKIAVLNVGDVRNKVLTESQDRRNLEVLHDPEEPVDPSHSGIYNLKQNDEIEIAELILETVRESYSARK